MLGHELIEQPLYINPKEQQFSSMKQIFSLNGYESLYYI